MRVPRAIALFLTLAGAGCLWSAPLDVDYGQEPEEASDCASPPAALPAGLSLQGVLLYGGFAGASGELYAVGARCQTTSAFAADCLSFIARSKNNGTTWDYPTLSTKEPLHAIWSNSKGEVYAVGDKGLILHSTDDGKSWRQGGSAFFAPLHSVLGSPKGEIYVAGGTPRNTSPKSDPVGAILRSSDQGKTWARTELEVAIYSLWGAPNGELYAAGDHGTLFHSKDSGLTWQKRMGSHLEPNSATSDVSNGDILSIWGSSSQDLYMVGNGGDILLSADGGLTWTKSSSYRSDYLALWSEPGGRLLIVGQAMLFESTNNGESWVVRFFENRPIPVPYPASSAWRSPSGDIYLAGREERFISNPVYYSAVGCLDCPMMLDTGADKSFLFRSKDGGTTWEDLTTLEEVPHQPAVTPPEEYRYERERYDCTKRPETKSCLFLEQLPN